MLKTITKYLFGASIILLATACQEETEQKEAQQESSPKEVKIVSLSGSLTEIIYTLGLGDKIVGVDVTSTFPNEVHQLPKLGHVSSLKAEGLISLSPTHILVEEGALSKDLIDQLTPAGIEVLSFTREYTVDGTKELIKNVALAFNKELPDSILQTIDTSLNQVVSISPAPKVLFIYGRSSGSLMVAGENTSMQKIIELSGGMNAVSGFEDFKPLSNEVLISSNPDYILLFNSAEQSLNGIEGIMEIPGIMETTAGKNKNFIFLDGQLISGFGPRIGEAALLLNEKLNVSNE